MELSEILKPEAVRSVDHLTSKKRLLREIADVAGSVYGTDASVALDALQERETLGPTGVGHGVAIPHARLPGLNSVVGVFFRLGKPMEFESVDRQPVDLVFALFAPENSGVDHLKALALVSRTLRDPNSLSKLRSNDLDGPLFSILTDSTTSKAA